MDNAENIIGHTPLSEEEYKTAKLLNTSISVVCFPFFCYNVYRCVK